MSRAAEQAGEFTADEMMTSRQKAAISGAPPAPGSRTFGFA